MDTILLVDDDLEIRKSIGEMLSRSGYQVVTAEEGAAALKVLEERRGIDLVIADYRLPGMDGIQLVRRIKELHPSLPVIMLTGHGDLESYLHAANLGVVRYVGKPIKLKELQRTVRDAVAEGLCERTLRQLQD